MDISIMIEGQMGLTWARWKPIVRAVEDLGFAGLFRSDHFVNPSAPDQPSLEMVTSLTYLADHTSRIRFGPLVAPVSFRDPIMLARQAAALAELSDGRMILGLGAGWMEREHEMFGYDLGDRDVRMSRLEEAVDVVVRLLRSDEPPSFAGRFYTLRDAHIGPRAPSMPIMIGGSGPKRTLPLVARYADVWNGFGLSSEAFRGRCARLDRLLVERGRSPGDVKRTMMTAAFPGRDDESVRARGAIAGSAEQMRAQVAALEAAGVEELMLQWFALDDLDGLAALADALLRS